MCNMGRKSHWTVTRCDDPRVPLREHHPNPNDTLTVIKQTLIFFISPNYLSPSHPINLNKPNIKFFTKFPNWNPRLTFLGRSISIFLANFVLNCIFFASLFPFHHRRQIKIWRIPNFSLSGNLKVLSFIISFELNWIELINLKMYEFHHVFWFYFDFLALIIVALLT